MSHGPLSGLPHGTWRSADRTWFRVAGAVVTLLVFSAGFVGIWLREGEEIGPLACLYATCKLFLFHGEASSLSWQQHHPYDQAAIGLISIAAFGGPVLTTVVIALLIRQLAAVIRDRHSIRATGHAVILGADREGVHWGDYLHRERKLPIVFVNLDDEGPHLGRARAIGKAVLVGDMRDAGTRRRAAVSRSKMVVVCTGNELANIDTARAIESETGDSGPQIFCRVVSQSLLYNMSRSARASSSRIRFFNIYDFVARDAIQATLKSAGEDAATKDVDKVHLIICGFGRFGQAVLHAAGSDKALFSRLSGKVHVVDLHAEDLLDEYKFSAPSADDSILEKTVSRRSGILNHALWEELLSEPAGVLRLVFICTDNDVTNLVHALAIKRLVEKKKSQNVLAIVVMRQFERPLKGEGGLLYATMGESTDEQIELLIKETEKQRPSGDQVMTSDEKPKGAAGSPGREDGGKAEFIEALLRGDAHKVAALLDSGADVNAELSDVYQFQHYSISPLMIAVWKGHEELAKLLLERGAQPKCEHRFGRRDDGVGEITPLGKAIEDGRLDMVKILLDGGASPFSDAYIGEDGGRYSREFINAYEWAEREGTEEIRDLLAERQKEIRQKFLDAQARTQAAQSAPADTNEHDSTAPE